MSNKKVVRQKEYVSDKKIPKNIEDPDRYLQKNPIWAFQRCDLEHERWSIKNCGDFYGEILDKLISFEGLTWAQILSYSGGRRNGTNNHFEDVSILSSEAQKRLEKLHIYVDQILSLRLTGTLRIYGIMENGVFNVLWYDPLHEICPSTKRHS